MKNVNQNESSGLDQMLTKSIPILNEKNSQHSDVKLTDVSHRNTVEQMTIELGLIPDLQASKIAVETDNLTLGLTQRHRKGFTSTSSIIRLLQSAR